MIGHTDIFPVKKGSYKNNMTLSSARAISVVKYYTAKNPDFNKRFSVTAFGSNKPLTLDNTKQQINRRIDLVFKRI